ncbi:hypothetical protein MBANPS3_005011 [Mucor bainieri]
MYECGVIFEPEDQAYCDAALARVPALQVDPIHAVRLNISSKRRDSDEVILHACSVLYASQDDQQKTLYIVNDALHLEPISTIDSYGAEANLLTHEDNVARIIIGNDYLSPITPSKQTFEQMNNDGLCKCASTATPDGIKRALAASLYAKLLCQRQFNELTPDVTHNLNKNWEFYPQTKFFTARLFTGSILHNTDKAQVIMVNTVEAYGRTKYVDPHREKFGKEKNATLATSLLPLIDTLYTDVWPVSLSTADGIKLIIRTQVSNILATPSIRLDIKSIPCIGSKSTDFILEEASHSLYTRIYLDIQSLQEAWPVLDKPGTASTSRLNHLY